MEAGDTVSITLKKEFGEEAMNSMEATEEEKKEIEAHIDTLFHNGEEVTSIRPIPPVHISHHCRYTLDMWTTRATQTMLGWKQLPTTSMMKQVLIINSSTHTIIQMLAFPIFRPV